MTILLDTHVLLWAYLGSADLPKDAIDLISDQSNEVAFSVASLWEVSLKSALGRADFNANVSELRARLLENGYKEFSVSGAHVLMLAALPAIHEDPFDRILIAQAASEGATLLTSDKVVSAYPGMIRRV